MGTTISPYLFFWQASQEVEDTKQKPARKPLLKAPRQGPDAIERIRADTYVGMAFSNIVALAIMITTAATLHTAGITDIESSSQAAEALRPVAGPFAFMLFTLGIVGTGLLAVPVLAGSAAYALGEARKWPIGLARQPRKAKAFYARHRDRDLRRRPHQLFADQSDQGALLERRDQRHRGGAGHGDHDADGGRCQDHGRVHDPAGDADHRVGLRRRSWRLRSSGWRSPHGFEPGRPARDSASKCRASRDKARIRTIA